MINAYRKPQEIGQTRPLKSLYDQCRQRKHDATNFTMKIDGCRRQTRSKLNIDAECQRLLSGFKDDVIKNNFSRIMHGFKSMYDTPKWQRSSLFKDKISQGKCHNCGVKFGIVKRKFDCCVCGQFVCADCSSTDLLVYIPDQQVESARPEPNLIIVKIVGCPAKEPGICMYLRGCSSCITYLQKRQVDMFHQQKLEETTNESWKDIVDLSKAATDTKLQIEKHLSQYQQLVESLEQEHVSKSPEQNQLQLIAKEQEDVSDYITQLAVTLQSLKRINPRSGGQIIIVKNLITMVCRDYRDALSKFGNLRSRLEIVIPHDVLRRMQEMEEKNVINAAYLSIRQLAYETIHLCDKYNMDTDITEQITAVEMTMYDELRERVEKATDDWNFHETAIRVMLQYRLKEHRLIKPSREIVKKQGVAYIRGFLLERCNAIAQRIQLELSVKCSDKSFAQSKKQLSKLTEYLHGDHIPSDRVSLKSESKSDCDFVFIDMIRP